MAKRKGGSQPTVSLFPFLSILACVIGTLTLMIAAVAIGQMDTPDLADAEEVAKVRRDVADAKAELDRLQAKLKKAKSASDDTTQDVLAMQQELQGIQQQVRKLQADASARAQAVPDMPVPLDLKELEQRVGELKKELAERLDQTKKLAEEIAGRKKPQDEAVVRVRPSGSGQNLKPHFVECTATSLVLHTGDKIDRIRKADIAKSPQFVELVKSVAARPNDRIVFLIRDDAVGTYYAAQRVALANNAANGKIPLIGHGNLDLSMFK